MFAHLHVHSPFSFCDGAGAIKDLVAQAACADIAALALTDHHSLSGAVRWQKLCRGAGIKPILGAEVATEDGGHLTLLARSRRGYANLCALLTEAHLSHERRRPCVAPASLERWAEDLICLSGCRRGRIRTLLRRGDHQQAKEYARWLQGVFGRENFFVELQHDLYPGDRGDLEALAELAEALGAGLVATNNVHYARREQFAIHDLLTCIREHVRIDEPHAARPINAERWLKPPSEMAALFAPWPQALENARCIAQACEDYELSGPGYVPRFPVPPGTKGPEMLRQLAYQGARERYGSLEEDLCRRLDHELAVIERMGFVDYFLIVWDVVKFARDRGIRYAGRGSCADSVVAYALGITNVDAYRRGLCFERFINPSRLNALPDIDVDFDARRRDEVAEYVIRRYGPDRVAGVCTFQCFQARGALRETAKVLGVPEHTGRRIASLMPHLSAAALPQAIESFPELRDGGIPWHKLRLLIELAAALDGLPRHIGTHLGGLVISAQPLTSLSPLQMAAKGIRIIGFDKEDIEELGLFKLDLLALRMLGAVDDSVRWTSVEYERLPLDDVPTYDMLRAGETVGAFQLESPAQRSLHQRLQPDNYEDIVASVALIRPGPVQANMVGPFVARRHGKEPVVFTDPRLERILGRTYGVVLFQEQVIELAVEIAGFSPGEADQLRRLMTHQRDQEALAEMAEDFVRRALARGASREVAEMAFKAIRAFAGYGFCEGHAAAFGDIGYRTAYLLRHYPAQFYAALLNNQPMGFYPPHTLLVEARRRGVKVLPLDINQSAPEYTAGDGWLRIGLKQVKGISEAELEAIVQARQRGPFVSLADFLGRVTVRRDVAERLILAGAFDTLCPNRKAMMWQLAELLAMLQAKERGEACTKAPSATGAKACSPSPSSVGSKACADAGAEVFANARSDAGATPCSDACESANSDARRGRNRPYTTLRLALAEEAADRPPEVEDFPAHDKILHEWDVLGFSLTGHPMALFRDELRKRGVLTAAQLKKTRSGRKVTAAGLVIRPHRPPTRSGRTVVFLSLEDETGLIDATIFEDVYRKYAPVIFANAALLIRGRLERNHGLAIVADRVQPLILSAPPAPP